MGAFSFFFAHTKIRKITHICNFIMLTNALIIRKIVKFCNHLLPPKLTLNQNSSQNICICQILFVPLYLIIRQLGMNKDKKIERLEQKLAKAQEEIKQLRSDVRKAKREKSKASKKKEDRTVTLTKEQQRLLSMLLGDIPIQDS